MFKKIFVSLLIFLSACTDYSPKISPLNISQFEEIEVMPINEIDLTLSEIEQKIIELEKLIKKCELDFPDGKIDSYSIEEVNSKISELDRLINDLQPDLKKSEEVADQKCNFFEKLWNSKCDEERIAARESRRNLMKQYKDQKRPLSDKLSKYISAGCDGTIKLEYDQLQEKASQLYNPNAIPQITDKGTNSLWTQIDVPIKNSKYIRSVNAYLSVINQFNVEHSYPCRYTPTCGGSTDTRCNIFAADVMRAMGAPLPTKEDLGKKGDPMTANANDLHKWLKGGNGGWRLIDPNNPEDLKILQEYLKKGKPVLASDPDHIAVVRPDGFTGELNKDTLKKLHIAQAGLSNRNDVELQNAGYGGKFKPLFFIHE